MEETDTTVSNASTITPSTDSTTVQQTTTTTSPNSSTIISSTDSTTVQQIITTISPHVCRVCGEPAQYSYFGAIVCQSCKVFFKRNAERIRSIPLKCKYDDHCEINVKSRHVCTSCRLAKCFASGMITEMIRSSRTKKTKTTQKKESTEKKKKTTDSTALVRIDERNQPEQLPTLNLLESDQSSLSVDQWNHLSNLVHCFDEYSGLQFIQNFIDEQTTLPPKFRFKHAPVNAFFTSMMAKVQLVFEKNRDFLSLSLHDRKTLLRSTVEYTTSIGAAFILHQFQLFDHPTFFKSAELIFRPSTVALIKRLIDQFDPDIMFIKILFGIISFIISNYTVYTHTDPDNLTDVKTIISNQDIYTELVWRYLIYKHNYHDAVLCFSNCLRCLLLVNDSVVEAHEERQFTDIIDSVIESTEQKLTLNT